MAIISKQRLSAITETKLGYRAFSKVLSEVKSERRIYVTTSIFLSHSHDDLEKEYVNKVIVLLRKSGVRIYIDSTDSTMPPLTNAETANKIKQKIKECDIFILLATNSAINSKWCNWELGFGDALKYIDKMALFPLSENSGVWYGNEYLQIYPRIEESNLISEYYKIIYPDRREISITDWLNQ
jgi:TIR domain